MDMENPADKPGTRHVHAAVPDRRGAIKLSSGKILAVNAQTRAAVLHRSRVKSEGRLVVSKVMRAPYRAIGRQNLYHHQFRENSIGHIRL